MSKVHAALSWDSGAWRLKDAGSRNGTFVQGHRLDAGHSAQLRQGFVVGLGPESPLAFRLVNDGTPKTFVVAPDETETVLTSGRVNLPDGGPPAISLLRTRFGWVGRAVDSSESSSPILDWRTFIVGGQLWRVYSPNLALTTQDAVVTTVVGRQAAFHLSLDEEQVEFSLKDTQGQPDVHLKQLASTYMLLTLARLRVADAARPDLPEAEHGWVQRAQLATMLKCEESHIATYISRARQQLIAAGILQSRSIIEDRRGGSIRFGLGDIVVEPLA